MKTLTRFDGILKRDTKLIILCFPGSQKHVRTIKIVSFVVNPEIVIQNELAFAHYDSYPVNPGHCLIITHRHVAEYFQATAEEKAAIWALVDEMKTIIDAAVQSGWLQRRCQYWRDSGSVGATSAYPYDSKVQR